MRSIRAGDPCVCESDVKTPQRFESKTARNRHVGKRETAIRVEIEGQRYKTFLAAAATLSASISASFSRLAA